MSFWWTLLRWHSYLFFPTSPFAYQVGGGSWRFVVFFGRGVCFEKWCKIKITCCIHNLFICHNPPKSLPTSRYLDNNLYLDKSYRFWTSLKITDFVPVNGVLSMVFWAWVNGPYLQNFRKLGGVLASKWYLQGWLKIGLKRYSVLVTTSFLWHESKDINKKKSFFFPKFQLIPILSFQVMRNYVCFIAPVDCVE